VNNATTIATMAIRAIVPATAIPAIAPCDKLGSDVGAEVAVALELVTDDTDDEV
jgi:hypothetical protein